LIRIMVNVCRDAARNQRHLLTRPDTTGSDLFLVNDFR
jgi:hypothetical protein